MRPRGSALALEHSPQALFGVAGPRKVAIEFLPGRDSQGVCSAVLISRDRPKDLKVEKERPSWNQSEALFSLEAIFPRRHRAGPTGGSLLLLGPARVPINILLGN
jgi:hypothetical protein